MTEIISLRKPREKHFLREDGLIDCYLYEEDIHYLKDGKYEQINNEIQEDNKYFQNNKNEYKVKFLKNKKELKLLSVEKDKYKLYLELSKKEKDFEIIYNKNSIKYINILENIDIKYELIGSKLKDSIYLKDKNCDLKNLKFFIKTDLIVEIKNNELIFKNQDNVVYVIEKPVLLDKKGKEHNIKYQLEKKEGGYSFDFLIEENILNDDGLYPLVIDPYLNNGKVDSVYDTYITNEDEEANFNNKDNLIVGVDKNNKIYRSMIKFDLPKLGVGDNVVKATAFLVTHKTNPSKAKNSFRENDIVIEEALEPWQEENATWKNCNNNHKSIIESYFGGRRSVLDEEKNIITLETIGYDITNLVKKWYSGVANNGFMLRLNKEVYNNIEPFYFFSKNNTMSTELNSNPKPYLIITYQNKNGLENSMTYQNIDIANGTSYINHYTGNVINVFNLNKTVGGNHPIGLNLIYNTNDCFLKKNYGYGIGFKLNFHQTLKEIQNDEKNYLEYLDGDGTIHYLLKKGNKYFDNEGLFLEITKEEELFIMKDKYGNRNKFIKINNLYYLTETIDTEKNSTSIVYIGEKISKITNCNDENIIFSYTNDGFSIKSKYDTTFITMNGERIRSIKTKFETTTIQYDANGNIAKILSDIGTSILYEYYNTAPYKLQKVLELGLNNTNGKALVFTYEYNVTKVKDHRGRTNIYTFNKNGNTTVITNLKSVGNFCDSYGILNNYDTENQKNKLLLSTNAQKYTNNLFSNSSFEKSFNPSDKGVIIKRNARSGKKCLLINTPTKLFLPNVSKKGSYTFSAYFKHDKKITLSLWQEEKCISQNYSWKKSTNYQRYTITSELKDLETTNNSYILVTPEEEDSVYVDDIQLEKEKIANYINLIENSDFQNNLNNWTVSTTDREGNQKTPNDRTLKLSNGEYAFYRKCALDESQSLSQIIHMSGKKNDSYRLSFWYKNNGIIEKEESTYCGHIITLNFGYKTDINHGIPMYNLETNSTEWQFFQMDFTAFDDFENIYLSLTSQFEVNDLYITHVTLTKDLGKNSYSYDEYGNLNSVADKTKEIYNFKYDQNNQLISSFEPKGNNLTFEYDTYEPTRLYQVKSSLGVSNRIIYDNLKNPIKTTIKNIKGNIDLDPFYIRRKSSDQYLYINFQLRQIVLRKNTCSIESWNFEKTGDFYYLKSSLQPLYAHLNTLSLEVTDKKNASIFELVKNENGSYSFKIKDSSNCITISNNKFIKGVYNKENANQQFYLECNKNKLYIETRATYKEDGKFIKTVIDSLEKETTYDIDEITGLTKSITNPVGKTTAYTYNEKEQLVKIKNNNKEINYNYNKQNLITKIKVGNKEYNFTYDNFLNSKEIKVNNNLLVSNEYEERNGNLIKNTYGNNQTREYSFDEMDRLKTLIKEDKNYNYTYDNQNQLSKISTLNEEYLYSYDFANRIKRYEVKNKNFTNSIDYIYDINNNVIEKNINGHKINYNFDSNDTITNIITDSQKINYQFDELGRLNKKDINSQLKTEYFYITNGNKTSTLIEKVKDGNDIFKYRYDDNYNITHIYKNDNLQKEYIYDDLCELIQSTDYEKNKVNVYTYDEMGNISKRKEYENDILIKEDTFLYTNENWQDELTNFNNDTITYDEIGNPTKIGNNILTYQNGKELKSYKNSNLNISYEYNKNGLRISKSVNGKVINYFFENSALLVEKRENDVLYYIRDEDNNLVGVEKNNELYYYKKNLQKDIIGIYDSAYNLIVSYDYDDYGKINSITDANGNEITDKTHIAHINPFRYRSYYYDEETKLYYLNSRYYNPEWGRFINADKIIGTNETVIGYNLFAYCYNNPINALDSEGNFGIFSILFSKKVVLAVVAIVTAVTTIAITQNPSKIRNYERVIENGLKNQYEIPTKEEIKETNTYQDIKTKVEIEENVGYSEEEKKKKPCTEARINNKTNGILRGKRMTIKESQNYVAERKSVMCDNYIAAYNVASVFDGFYEDVLHDPSYYPHFHPDSKKNHPHIWYIP